MFVMVSDALVNAIGASLGGGPKQRWAVAGKIKKMPPSAWKTWGF